jgi:predicted transcriptional regulator
MAYTTVMTTLTRLFVKGVLVRRKVERKFLYRPCFTGEEWHKRIAMEAAVSFLSTPDTSRDLLMSCLQEAIGEKSADHQ